VKRLGEYAREITLLGQTVSSYRAVHDGSLVDLAELLYRVHQASPVSRIRFITSYPNDFNDGIFHAMAELDRVCPYLHIPAQHGSNRILSLMNRRYTVEEYLDLIESGRRIVPGLSLAGDFIVGFPTETEEDHESSLKLMRTIRYKNCFMFKYSVRPGTLAEKKFSDDISDDVKTLRHRQMLDLQNLISLEDNQSMIGQSVRILVEGISKKNRHQNEEIVQLVGRTLEDKIVVFDGKRELIGKNIEVRITSATALTLFADRVQG
jgi:tRNA-2-methylthio-N6-dimethylallyladenosine synthase